MSELILITGGARSGKSTYALKEGESRKGPRAFIATGSALDPEMKKRIRKHQKDRDSKLWETIEEEIELASVIENASKYKVLLIDCLTLWISNMLLRTGKTRHARTEERIDGKLEQILEACGRFKGSILFVTNETGMGIVPLNPLARLFRDIAGKCNQKIAQAADTVVFMTCGLPLIMKGKRKSSLNS